MSKPSAIGDAATALGFELLLTVRHDWGIFGQKAEFPGDFQGPNLTMREDFGAKSLQKALISKGLKIICKVSREICTPWSRGEGSGSGGTDREDC
jgi:hypothetical protein